MAHTSTLTLGALVQDTAGSAPVTVANDTVVDQVVDLEEFTSQVLVIPPNTLVGVSPVISDFAALQVKTLFVKSTRPVTMKVGSAGVDVYTVRSVFCETYLDGEAPNQLKFGNTDLVNSALVTIVAGSKQP
jgi:hypothetical protein